ncbi:FKBP-type peptidyl-prolyl cis-trans isomerase, partial [Myxococcota bacterium]|nr:FKBP-type peptidyl-prolyl cis-trans isomerase [Myxococcota bacterium]
FRASLLAGLLLLGCSPAATPADTQPQRTPPNREASAPPPVKPLGTLLNPRPQDPRPLAVKRKSFVTTSGLKIEILAEGKGALPSLSSTVTCHYRGLLTDGTEFDSSIKRGQPLTLKPTQVIQGWREALLLMPKGSKWRVTIPSDLAYGKRGVPGTIPPNSTLVFEIELLDIN